MEQYEELDTSAIKPYVFRSEKELEKDIANACRSLKDLSKRISDR